MELAHILRQSDASLLDDFVGFGFGKTGFKREGADDRWVEAMELMPPVFVASLDASEEADARVDGLAFVLRHASDHSKGLTVGDE